MRTLIFLLSITTCYAQIQGVKLADGSTLKLVTNWEPVLIKWDTMQQISIAKGSELIFYVLEAPKDHNGFTVYIQSVPKVDTPIQIDTIDSESLIYAGWTRHGTTSAAGWYKGTISYSGVGTATHIFNGTKVQIFGETGLNNGTATITIDNQTAQATWKKDKQLPALIYEKTLASGQHTLTIQPNGDGNVTIDYLVITK